MHQARRDSDNDIYYDSPRRREEELKSQLEQAYYS
jgi:hypothetical protein